MRPGRFGGFLLATGAAVGVAAVVGLVAGFHPSQLPPALLDLAVYKLTFIAAAGLLAAGAIVRRYSQRDAQSRERSPVESSGLSESKRLPDAAPDFSHARDQSIDVRVPKQP